jgi:hypothetical protein
MPGADASFFTRRPAARFAVPHGPLGERWLLVAHVAVTRAFKMIRAEGYALSSALENDITIKLESVLNNQILNRGEVEGFDKVFFGKVRRVEVVNFDGTKKSKKPDLCFDLHRENRVDWDQLQDALFAECKPVDKSHSLNGHYCALGKDCTGIERFVIGDYAWAMQEAMMIGYVRDGFRIHPHLAKSLADPQRHKLLGEPTVPEPVPPGCEGKEALYRTRHLRRFPWKETGQSATSIILYHSWHDCG